MDGENKNKSFGKNLSRTLGILLALVVLAACTFGVIYAKYISTKNTDGNAGVAKAGNITLELKEHEAVETEKNSGEYKLLDGTNGTTSTEVESNSYDRVFPGVDIPKDPFVRLKIENAEVNYSLYVKVKEDNIPYAEDGTTRTIKFTLTSEWIFEETKDGVDYYRYVGANPNSDKTKPAYVFNAGTNVSETKIQIINNNKLEVSQHYNGDPKKAYSLTFEAYLRQVNK